MPTASCKQPERGRRGRSTGAPAGIKARSRLARLSPAEGKALKQSLRRAQQSVTRSVRAFFDDLNRACVEGSVVASVGDPARIRRAAVARLNALVRQFQRELRVGFAEVLSKGRPGSADEPAQGSPHPPTSPHARQIVQAMLDYVRDHYQRPMALKDVATHLGMNANYLSGLFHAVTGTTFHRHLCAVRMTRAEEMLRQPQARICDVASAVGYASANHFRNAFKAWERLSPRAWAEHQQAPDPEI